MGEHEKAIADFARAEAVDPAQWGEDAMGLLYQADSHAQLGNEGAALSYCARLPDDFWTPGPNDAPPGNKAEIANELRHLAAEGRRNRQKL